MLVLATRRIILYGRDLVLLAEEVLLVPSNEISKILQELTTSLNPRMRIGKDLGEPLAVQGFVVAPSQVVGGLVAQ
jgi:ABC-type microcin C transport system duplicated ATPase subunit YejF